MTGKEDFCIKMGAWDDLRSLALPLRIEVFVNEQGVPLELEEDEFDWSAMHVVVMREGESIATGRILSDGRIGRLAVKRRFRGQGLGRQVFEQLLEYAKVTGIRSLHLHARCDAQFFYTPFGFEAVGEKFMEAGSWHVVMVKSDHAS